MTKFSEFFMRAIRRHTPIQKHWNIGYTLSVSPSIMARLNRSVWSSKEATVPPTNKYVVVYTNWFVPLIVRIRRIAAHYDRFKLSTFTLLSTLLTFASRTEYDPTIPEAVAYKNGNFRAWWSPALALIVFLIACSSLEIHKSTKIVRNTYTRNSDWTNWYSSSSRESCESGVFATVLKTTPTTIRNVPIPSIRVSAYNRLDSYFTFFLCMYR